MLSRFPLPAFAGLNLVLLSVSLALLAPPSAARRPAGPARLHLHWVRDLAPLEPTWPDQPRFTSDAARRPVPAGDVVLLSCARTDSLLALNASTGSLRWRFTADGPVRFAPAVWGGRAYVVSDDGLLYCLDVGTGQVRWSFRGGPSERRVLGNERLISTWPARGAPAVAEDGDEATVYFAAGVWPFMGIFLHALDARTGEVRWSNGGDGALYIKQPHQTDAFAGVAPQGSLVVAGDRLLVPGGRSLAACYDRHTGKLLHYRLADNSRKGGGPDVTAGASVYLNGGGVFDQLKGNHLGPVAEPADLRGSALYSVSGTVCRAFDLGQLPEPPPPPDKGKKNEKKLPAEAWLGEPAGQVSVPRTTALLASDERLYGAGPGKVYALSLPLRNKVSVFSEAAIEGTPLHLAAGGGRLFVSTREGRVYAFGAAPLKPRRHPRQVTPLPAAEAAVAERAKEILQTSKVREGYAVLWGAGTGGLADELLRQSALRLVVVEPDAAKAAELRKRLIAADIDFKRLSVLPRSPAEAQLPPYLCALMAAEDLSGFEVDDAFFELVYRSLRPYGGVACLPLSAKQAEALRAWEKREPTAAVKGEGNWTLLTRAGALPGAGNWTHEHGDAANTRVSADRLVKAPLGLLWFGGPGHQGILPRHGHGPVPQAVDGRLVIEGVDQLRAIDVYTGRQLWEAKLPGLGKVYDNLAHQAGANAVGSNYVCLSDGIFVAYQRACLRLDPETGKVAGRYELPPLKGEKRPPEWTFLAVSGDYLIGAASATPNKAAKEKKGKVTFRGQETSKRLSVLDRRTGRVLWSAEASQGWRHNAVCAGGGRLFAIDRTPLEQLLKLPGKKDSKPDIPPRLVCFDLATGKQLWAGAVEAFGTWLSYSAEHDVLVEAGLMSRDTLVDEAPGMRAWQASSGQVLWHRKDYFGPALIHGDRILKGGDARAGSGTACELRTGLPIRDRDPLTGEPRDWRWIRNYGCNTPAACENLILFRSGAAGFYDLAGDAGTGNLGGFRSSCTMNLIAAGGVLTIPDYTRTCTCSYQQQASVGLIHMPQAELWTFTTARQPAGVIRRAGINLGAPGSRKDESGTLWLEYPVAGGPSPRLTITTVPAKPDTFRFHSSQVSGDGPAWVAGGVRGLKQLTIRLGPDAAAARKYTVTLLFIEPDRLVTGQRLIDVALQGETRLRRLDVSKEAGGPGRRLVRTIKGVEVRRDLTITLTPDGVLSGVEVILE